ncbi:MAG: hypothetical protein AAGI38_20555 [Bacteroidota bacterium]
MKQRELLLGTLMLIALVQLVNAQGLNLIVRGNIAIGTEYQSLDFWGRNLSYSPGGGLGVEVGVQFDMLKGFGIQLTLGRQFNYTFHEETVNGITNRSSFTFNRRFISLGVLKNFTLTDGIVNSLQVGAGTNLNYPGTMTRVENEVVIEESSYYSNFGIYIDLVLRLKITDQIFLDPGIRYRQLNFSAESFSEGAVSELPDNLQEVNASGVEIGLTFVQRL